LALTVRGELVLRVVAEDVARDVRPRALGPHGHDTALRGVREGAQLGPDSVCRRGVVVARLEVDEVRAQPGAARLPGEPARRRAVERGTHVALVGAGERAAACGV